MDQSRKRWLMRWLEFVGGFLAAVLFASTETTPLWAFVAGMIPAAVFFFYSLGIFAFAKTQRKKEAFSLAMMFVKGSLLGALVASLVFFGQAYE